MMKKGFTLLEVLIVVIIIGILATIALPQYISTLEKARSGEAMTNVGTLRSSMERYWYDQGATAGYTAATLARLDVDDPNSVSGRLYNYVLTDTGNVNTKRFTIRANRIGKAAYWVQWTQTNNTTGRLYKSNALGGPES